MTKRIQIRMSDEDYRDVNAFAKSLGVSAADYCYAKVTDKAVKKRPVGLAAASKAMRRKVSRAGPKGQKEASRG